MRIAKVALVWVLAFAHVSKAAPLPAQTHSGGHSFKTLRYEETSLRRRLMPWLYTAKISRKQLGGTVGAGFTVTGAALAMSGWYLNESSKDMNDRVSDMNRKISAAKKKRLEREVAEMWEHRAAPPRKSVESKHGTSKLDRRWSWGGTQTEKIMKAIEDYGKAGAGTLSLTAGSAVLINAVYDNQEARKKLARTRASFDERLSRAEAKPAHPGVQTTPL